MTRKWMGVFLALVAGCSAGCAPPSLLITPVSSRKSLVETELDRDSWMATDKIAVIDVSGLLINSPRPQLFGDGEHPVSMLVEQLDMASKDSRVKAVILRINSPGGTVTASDLMYQEIRHFRSTTGKPIVAMMMDVAASGGYYIACACDEITAQPMTVTGSIGVVMQMFDLSGTMSKIGLRSDSVTSGDRKDSGSPFRPMRPEEREMFQAMVDQMFDRFVEVVVCGRPKLDEATVRRLADGRVYTAPQAASVGLIDRVSPFREVVQSIRQRIGARSVRLITYNRPLAYRPNFYAASPAPQSGDVNLLKVDAASWWTQPAPQFLYLWNP